MTRRQQSAIAAAFIFLQAGCALRPVSIDNVIGPNPYLPPNPSGKGTLEVFTAKEMETQAWDGFENMRRTGYYIYDGTGKLIAHVGDNNLGKYDSTPASIALAPGSYKITALMAEYLGQWVSVPVRIESGMATQVHLDKDWSPPNSTAGSNFVHAPGGGWIGWSANASR